MLSADRLREWQKHEGTQLLLTELSLDITYLRDLLEQDAKKLPEHFTHSKLRGMLAAYRGIIDIINKDIAIPLSDEQDPSISNLSRGSHE